MALNPVVLAGIAFCRGYHGLDYDDSELVARTAFDLLEDTDDESDYFEKVDLVWGAALADGTISPGDWSVPVDPRSPEVHAAHMRTIDHWAQAHQHDRPRPVEYDDPTFKPKKRRKKKKKRRTLPDV